MNAPTHYSHAEKLKHELTQPLFNTMLKQWVGKGELDYERYLHTGTLLNLQSPENERVSHDELMFQIVHQSQELYLKLASREMVEVVAELDRDGLWLAVAKLQRVQRILQCITSEMAILETMTPDEYQIIRRSLGNGSGQESPGYNTLRMAAGGLEAAMERMLERRGLTLFQVYSPSGPADLKHVCEQLVTVDEGFQGWLYAHFQLVRRTIGIDRAVKALDGLPSQVLQGRMNLPLFRALWDVRVEMTSSWKREGGYMPGEKRPGGGCPMAHAHQDEAGAHAGATATAHSHAAHGATAHPHATHGGNASTGATAHAGTGATAHAYAAHGGTSAHVSTSATAHPHGGTSAPHAGPAHASADAHEARTGGGCPLHAHSGATAHPHVNTAAHPHLGAAHAGINTSHAGTNTSHAGAPHLSAAHAVTTAVHASGPHLSATAHPHATDAHEARTGGGCPMHAHPAATTQAPAPLPDAHAAAYAHAQELR